jgi:ring-1,2-phenylacetyl-CoA epoxidase subunit PaaC
MDFFNEQQVLAAKELLYKIADDHLILGHRNSEWTGLGPLLEEDIAFSSMAQDKIGQSEHLYNLLHDLGEADADTVAFTRNKGQFHCCQMVELPIGTYDFSLVRHFLFDFAAAVRFDLLAESSYENLAKIVKKYRGEVKYHTMHANTWMMQLSAANEESHTRIQNSLNELWNQALGMFEEGPYEGILKESGIFLGEKVLKERWLSVVLPLLEKYGLTVSAVNYWKPVNGGRAGQHTEHLQPLLDEMCEVFSTDPSAEW